jgi:hypothetical protein
VDAQETPRQKSGEIMPATIPLELLERFADVAEKWGVRGKFSIIPCPAGLGSITTGWPGADSGEISRWLAIVRKRLVPAFDISPELLTHTRALDVQTGRLLPESEHGWSQHQDEKALTAYITRSLEILRAASFDATGVTSPCDFGVKVEAAYSRAVLNAQRAVYGRRLSWYFLHIDQDIPGKQSCVAVREGDHTVVSIVAKGGDCFWQTMETQETGNSYVNAVADELLTASGDDGHLAALRAAKVPVVMLAHWQSLYSNGRYTGIRAFERVCERVAARWVGKAEWISCAAFAKTVADNQSGRS